MEDRQSCLSSFFGGNETAGGDQGTGRDYLSSTTMTGNTYSQFLVAPSAMPTIELLPGVSEDSCPPRVVCDARAAIVAARRRALLRDALQIALLLAVDYLFIYWPESHVPLLSRGASLTFLWAFNFMVVAGLWLTRALPKWRSKRIAETWCRSERDRFKR